MVGSLPPAVFAEMTARRDRLALLLSALLLVVVQAGEAARRGPAVLVPAGVDRTLHIRSIPPVSGYNSHIYEVLMTPYIDKVAAAAGRAVATLRSAEGHALGTLEVRESRAGLVLTGIVSGLVAGQQLGVSVHASGDCARLGPVFRPDQPNDAPPSPATPAGYLGSTAVSEDGHSALLLSPAPRLSLSGHRSVLGRAVALHPMSTEPGHPPSAPVACGVIGRALPSAAETAAARRRRHFMHAAPLIAKRHTDM